MRLVAGWCVRMCVCVCVCVCVCKRWMRSKGGLAVHTSADLNPAMPRSDNYSATPPLPRDQIIW